VLLRHLVATLAYRAAKVLRDAPPGFRRNDLRIVHADARANRRAHGGPDVLGGEVWRAASRRGKRKGAMTGMRRWRDSVDGLAALDAVLASDDSLRGPVEQPVEKLIQGPLADALTHVGQLAMLRRMAGRRFVLKAMPAPKSWPAASASSRRRRARRSTVTRAFAPSSVPFDLRRRGPSPCHRAAA
jgi:hypothetical protein